MQMRLKDVLQKTTAFFSEKGFASARLDTELLFASALKWERIQLYMNYDYPLSAAELDACRALVRRRAQGEPIAYILGTRDFYKSTFSVEPGVLIPRPETELLVEETVAWLRANAPSAPMLVDLGTGSGCIGLSVLVDIADARLLACDVSPKALEVTMRNAERLGVADRVQLREGDAATLSVAEVLSVFSRQPDAVVANPPYISPDDSAVEEGVRKFEPSEALFSEQSGFGHIRAWAKVAAEVVRPGGFVMFEIGADQGEEAASLFSAQPNFDSVSIIKDLARHDRFIRCVRREGETHG